MLPSDGWARALMQGPPASLSSRQRRGGGPRKKNLSCSAPEPMREGGRRRREAQGLQPTWSADRTTEENEG